MQVHVADCVWRQGGNSRAKLRGRHPWSKSDVLLTLFRVSHNELVKGLGIPRVISRSNDAFAMIASIDRKLWGRHPACADPTLTSLVACDRWLHDPSEECLRRAAE